MNEEQFFLANAYLDGELTAEERGIAEADPAVMAEIEQLRALQNDLRDVEPPSDAARESAIGAALAEFTSRSSTSTSTGRVAPAVTAAPAAPIVFRRRPAYARYLGVAAAMVAVGLLGIVVVNGLGAGDDDSSDLDTAMVVAEDTAAADTDRAFQETMDTASEDSADAAEMASEPVAGEEMADDEVADDGGGDVPSADVGATAADTNDDMVASDDAEESREQPSVSLVPGAGLSRSRPLDDADDLALFGAQLLDRRDAGDLGPTPETACPTPNVLSEAYYLVDDVAVRVLVAVDETPDAETVVAINPDNCDVVAESPLLR